MFHNIWLKYTLHVRSKFITMAPSPAWQYFEKINDGTNAQCKICNKVLKFHGSTTSLSSHLMIIHKIELKKPSPKVSQNPATSEVEVAFVGPLDKSFKTVTTFSAGGYKFNIMMDALMFMVVKDNLPLQTPQKEGFQLFCKKLQPLYKPPSVITFVQNLNKKYGELSGKVKKELETVDSVCLTTDLWTHKHTMQGYLGLTAHYLLGTNIKSVELGAYPMDERKTIENLRVRLREICDSWGLHDEKISAILSDGGANVKGAIRQEFGNFKHISCFAHSINNIGQRVIDINIQTNTQAPLDVPDSSGDEEELDFVSELADNVEISPLRQLLRKVKSIVRFFRSSEVATKELKQQQLQSGNKNCLKLIQEVRTRWNSCYEMVERFLLLADHVGRVLLQMHMDRVSRSKAPIMLNGDELDALTEVRDILKPLWNITKEISSEKTVTLSKCIPLVVALKMKIMDFNPSTKIGKQLQDKLSKEVDNKYHSIESVKAYAAATLLDPRFKKIAFSKIQDVPRVIMYLGELIQAEIEKTRCNLPTIYEEHEVEVVPADPDDIWHYIDSTVSKEKQLFEEHDNALPLQLRQFLNTPTVNRKANPNPFIAWEVIQNEYPYVWKIAKKMLPIVATSVPSERLFSHAGIIANQLRNRISPQHLNQLVFLRSLEEKMWF
ncbi:E3 SUMO-protein ligase ZBED1-like [Haematobia irritans]|uniref:E3 SUMO-protein ligase ZBED1-like n=1 Tax=Haematobia irritans TaxID=7368 RepID=UPI003F500F19